MDYGEILGKAWRITWKHKGLWILGILAGCSASGGGSGGGGSSNVPTTMENGDLGGFEHQFSHSPFIQWLSDIPVGVWIAMAVGLVLFFVVLSLVFWVLGSIGKSGLYAGFKQADETGSTSLKEAFSSALRSFWKILVIELVVGLAGFILAMILIVPVVLFTVLTLGIGMLCILPLICLLIPLSILISILIRFVEIAATADEIPLTETPGHVWQLVKKSPGDTIIIAIILGVIGLIIGLVIGLPILLVFIPAVAGGLINAEQLLLPGIVGSVVLLLVYIPIAVFFNGILQTYTLGAWTLFYERLKAHPGIKKEALPAPEANEEDE